MKASFYHPFFILAVLIGFITSTSSISAGPPWMMRMNPAPAMATKPMQQPLTQTQQQILQQRLQLATIRNARGLVGGENLLLMNQLMAAGAYNPYAAGVNPYSAMMPSYPSSGYGGGGSYSSNYYMTPHSNPYAPYAPSPYAASNPNLDMTGIAPKAAAPAKGYQAPMEEVSGQQKKVATILTGLGIPNSNGQVNWPESLQFLKPAKESNELRMQVEADLQIVAGRIVQGAAPSVFIQEGKQAIDKLNSFVNRNKESMSAAAFTEAEQFLTNLRQALQAMPKGE